MLSARIFKNLSIVILLILCCISCKSINYNSIKIKKAIAVDSIRNNLKLNRSEIDLITSKDTIIAELFLALKDSVNTNNLKQHLDAFYSKTYSSKKLKVAIQMERYVKKNGGNFKLSDSLDPNNAFHVKNMKGFDSIVKLMRKKFGKPNLKVTTNIGKKDSLKN